MNASISNWQETGLEVSDLAGDTEFAARKVHGRDIAAQMEGMHRLAHAFVENPQTMLKELVYAAVELCGADSAGISVERADGTDDNFYHWVATAGQYSHFLDANLPRYPSACGICLIRGQAQHFRVGQRFFDIMGIEAPLVTDGILLPWEVGEMRGTIFIMAHGRSEAFDEEDLRMMKMLADFTAMGIRHQRQQTLLMEQERATAAANMANDLAHKINNPLQSLTNILYLAANGSAGQDARDVGQKALDDLRRLSSLVQELLALPTQQVVSKADL